MSMIRVNGDPIKSRHGVILKPNDRICFGTKYIFLFKHKNSEFKEDKSMKADTLENPITYQFAMAELQLSKSMTLKI